MADVATVVPGRSPRDAAIAALHLLAGWRVTTEDHHLIDALADLGALPTRHARIMRRPVAVPDGPEPAASPFVPHAVPSSSDPALWAPVLPAWRAAFPPEHPDHLDVDDAGAIDFHMRLVDGSDMGPLHRSSCLLTDANGRVVAGIMVNVREGDPRSDGPWIADIWRDPSLRGSGVGSRLIERAAHQLGVDGFTSLSLAVTAGNDAESAYERAGFATVMDSRIFLLPT